MTKDLTPEDLMYAYADGLEIEEVMAYIAAWEADRKRITDLIDGLKRLGTHPRNCRIWHVGRMNAKLDDCTCGLWALIDARSKEDKMTREEFDALPSDGREVCPDCGSRRTHPHPNCSCPLARTAGGFEYTRHINREHHTCVDQYVKYAE